MDAESLVRPVVEGADLELYEVSFRQESGRQILRVMVDRAGGVDLDTLAEVSEKLSRRLDLEDFGRGRYQLEVSTPGIERALRTPAHFRLAIGEQVKVKTAVPVADAKVHEGTLTGADDETIEVEVHGQPRRIALADVASARTVVDWAAELKGRSA
jgi:ribosome maturation factor RimP